MTDRYVHPTLGTDSGPGTARDASAWRTLQYALSAASASVAGDRIRLQSGNYDEFITPEKSGTPSNPITIEADAGASPVMRGANGVEGIVDISAGKKYLTFGAGIYYSYGWGPPGGNYRFPWFQVGGVNTANIIIKNCTFERPGWADRDALATSPWAEYAIQIDGAKNVTVDTVLIRGTNIGIQPKGVCTGGTIIRCDIGYTALSNIVLGDSGGVNRSFVIAYNDLHHSAVEDGIQFHQDFGALDDSLDMSNVGTAVWYNRIHDEGENGIDLKGAQKVLIEGNIIYRCAGSSGGFHPTEGNNFNSMGSIIRGARTSTKDVIVRNNVVYDSCGAIWAFPGYKIYNNTCTYNLRTYLGTNTANLGRAHGVRQQGPSARVGVKNNIFDNHEYDTQWYTENSQPQNEVDANYNLYASNRWSSIINSLAVTLYTTLTGWKNKLNANNWRFGKEGASLAVASHAAVGFINVPATPTGDPALYNFGTTGASPAKNNGGPLTKTVGAGTNSGTVTLLDAGWFSDIFGRTDILIRDRIFFAGQERTVTAVDYTANTVSFTPNASWIDGQDVFYIMPGQVATSTPTIGALNFSATGPAAPPAPPTPGGPGGRAMGQAPLNLPAGNQVIPLSAPMSGLPTAWRFTLSLALLDDNPAIGAVIGRGWAWNNAGTIVQGAICLRSNDTTQSTGRRTINDGCGFLTLPGASTIDTQFVLVSGGTNDVTINIINPPNAAYLLTAEAFVVKNAYFGQVPIQIAQDGVSTVNCGFMPNYWEFATANRAIPGSVSNVNSSFGLATRTGATITQSCFAYQSKNVSTPTQVAAHLRNDFIGGLIDDFGTLSPGLLLTAVGPTSFGIATKLAPHPDPDLTPAGFVFALEFDLQVYSGIVSAPLAANAALDYPIGFAPGSADILQTHLPLVNTADFTGAAGAWGYGAWDGAAQYCTSIADEDGASLPNTQSQNDNRFINVDQHNGLAGLVAAVVGPQTTNLRLGYSGVTGVAAKGILVAIGESFVPTLTPNFTGTPLTGVGALSVAFTNSSSATGTVITSYAWDFGDGSTSTATNPTHIYSAPGVYTVTLAVSDGAISNIKVRTDYIVVADPETLGIDFASYVIAAGSAPELPTSDVFAVAGSA